MRILLIVSGMLALAGCQQESTSEKPETAALEPTVANIKSLIGEPSASDVKACKLLEIGEKACGGPEQHLVYSTETVSDQEQLLSLVREYNRLSRQRKEGQYSTCEFIPRPRLELVDGVCETE